MEQLVEQGRFRLDLYYRLNVIPIQIPALRERHDCIVPLIRHYIDEFSHQTGVHKRLTRAALDALTVYPYPGNVRELMNLCERMVVMSETELIDLSDLPAQVTSFSTKTSSHSTTSPRPVTATDPRSSRAQPAGISLSEIQQSD